MNHETIWRYMDFTKFVALISSGSLFFCRADRFEDPFEGSITTKHYQNQVGIISALTSDNENEIKLYEKFGEEYRKHVYINCWHQNDIESAALWKIYLKSNEGICIKSSRFNLSSSLYRSDVPVWTVPVKYIDYQNDDVPMPTKMAPFRYKRKCFSHENEIRALIYADNSIYKKIKKQSLSEYGISVNVIINELIQEIIVAPTSPKWFFELVQHIVKEYYVDAPVKQSAILIENPIFGTKQN